LPATNSTASVRQLAADTTDTSPASVTDGFKPARAEPATADVVD